MSDIQITKLKTLKALLVEMISSEKNNKSQRPVVLSKWYYQNRIFRKILSHTIGVFLNMQNGNKPLQLALLADF